MRLRELLEGMTGIEIIGAPDVDIASIACDSRKVAAGGLFVAIRGLKEDGAAFIPDAVSRGAVCVLADARHDIAGVAVVVAQDVRRVMAHLADRIHRSPQESLVMTAVTGTNGKTTTSYMIRSIFEAAGMNCGLIGTIRHIVAGENVESVNTTPESVDIHEYLARMVAANEHACVMEVSSHALALSRVHGIRFRAAAFLNLTRDHLDFHGDENSYLEAKGLLFSGLAGDATAVVNGDDPAAHYIATVSRGARMLTFGGDDTFDIHPVTMVLGSRHTDAVIATPAGEFSCRLALPGRFNVSNAMAAAAVALACGIPLDRIAEGLSSLTSVSGRYEVIDEGQDFTVIVDYAHTPDALERILASAREITTGGLIALFGCGGDRDRGKRPQMAAIAERIADRVIVTSDNPRTEDPEAIIADIVAGFAAPERHETVPDRRDAIARAIGAARAGDTVVIAGKGHEDYQIIGTQKRHFDDVETAREFLRARS